MPSNNTTEPEVVTEFYTPWQLKKDRILSNPVRRGKDFERFLLEILSKKLSVHTTLSIRDGLAAYNSARDIDAICRALGQDTPKGVFEILGRVRPEMVRDAT